jgi:hypothetical protein
MGTPEVFEAKRTRTGHEDLMNEIPDSIPDRLIFWMVLRSRSRCVGLFDIPQEGWRRTHGQGGFKIFVNAGTGSFAKLPIGEPFDVRVNGQAASIGLFEILSDCNHSLGSRLGRFHETEYFSSKNQAVRRITLRASL